jgi:hypothetical protein
LALSLAFGRKAHLLLGSPACLLGLALSLALGQDACLFFNAPAAGAHNERSDRNRQAESDYNEKHHRDRDDPD